MARIKSKKYTGIYFNELQNGDRSYYIVYKNDDDKKVWEKIGKKSEGITENFCNQKRNEIITKIRLGEAAPVKHKKRDRFTFQKAFNEYLKWAKANKKTWSDDERHYNGHLKERFGSSELVTLKTKDFEAFKQEKLDAGYKGQSVIHYLAIARHTINKAIQNELVKNYVNPISGGRVRMPELNNKKLAFLMYEDAKKLLDALKNYNIRCYQLTILALFTGARFGEIASLTWHDVNFSTNQIYFKPTKNGNERHIFIVDEVKEILNSLKLEAKGRADLIIKTPSGGEYDRMPPVWQKKVDEIFEGNDKAGQNRITPHTLRHTHASWLAMSGVDILHIKEQLGHKTLDMTMRYAHLIPNKRHEATEKLSKSFKGVKNA